jgi:hypothetical protein
MLEINDAALVRLLELAEYELIGIGTAHRFPRLLLLRVRADDAELISIPF